MMPAPGENTGCARPVPPAAVGHHNILVLWTNKPLCLSGYADAVAGVNLSLLETRKGHSMSDMPREEQPDAIEKEVKDLHARYLAAWRDAVKAYHPKTPHPGDDAEMQIIAMSPILSYICTLRQEKLLQDAKRQTCWTFLLTLALTGLVIAQIIIAIAK